MLSAPDMCFKRCGDISWQKEMVKEIHNAEGREEEEERLPEQEIQNMRKKRKNRMLHYKLS